MLESIIAALLLNLLSPSSAPSRRTAGDEDTKPRSISFTDRIEADRQDVERQAELRRERRRLGLYY